MKKTARFILIALLAVVSSNLYAQLGVQLGYVYLPSNGNLTLGAPFGEFSGTTRNHGFQAGLTYEFTLRGELGMQTGLLYTYSGGRVREFGREIAGIRGTQYTSSVYQFLELPLRVSYSLAVTHDFKFFFFGGPSFSYALQGSSLSSRITGLDRQQRFPDRDVYQDFADYLSPFELRAGLGLGVHFQNYRVKFGYDMGILNIYNGEPRNNAQNDRFRLRRNQFSFSIGYVF